MLDTNVLLSAFFTHGVCEVLLDRIVKGQVHTIVCSDHIIAEFIRNARKKFAPPNDDLDLAVGLMRHHFDVVEPATISIRTGADPDDLPVLGTAVGGGAEVLVTGDAALLKLGTIRGVPIVSPRTFFENMPL